MSNSNSNIKSSDDIGISKSTFFAGSLAAFSSGLLFGVWRVIKKEKTNLKIKTHKSQIFFALSALGYGSILCIGSFAAAGALFSYTTKVTTLKDFDIWAKGVGSTIPIGKEVSTKSIEESLEVEKDLNNFFDAIFKGSNTDTTNNTNTIKTETNSASASKTSDKR